jgi:hypothetical protein
MERNRGGHGPFRGLEAPLALNVSVNCPGVQRKDGVSETMPKTPNRRLYDTRLLGRWRSDARRTGQDLAARRDISATQKRWLRGLFGRLELRYTRNRCYATLDGRTEGFPYSVVAKDSSSVAVVSYDAQLEGATISHLHFDGSHMWVAVGTGMFREFFKRVQEPRGSSAIPRGTT